MSGLLSAFLTALLAVSVGAQDRARAPEAINSSFNSWLLEGLQAARKEWRADACFGSAEVRIWPESISPTAHTAGGELYEFYFYSPSTRDAYRFRSPFQASSPGVIPEDQQTLRKGPGPANNPSRCVSSIPVALRRAYGIAFGPAPVLGDDVAVCISLNDFSVPIHTEAGDPESSLGCFDRDFQKRLSKVKGLQWQLATLKFGAESTSGGGTSIDWHVKTLVDVDAASGRRVMVYPR